jgi:hypothetical protein
MIPKTVAVNLANFEVLKQFLNGEIARRESGAFRKVD